jgi:ketosteroid isomerase-like protein
VGKDMEKDFRLTLPQHLIGDRGVLEIGNLTCKLYHVPGLHTRSNLTIFIPELGLLFTRREFDGQELPVLETGADLGKLISSLEDILACGKPIKFLLTGHGRPLADPDLLPALNYLRTLKTTVQEFRLLGRTLEELRAAAAFASLPAVQKSPASHLANLEIVWKEDPRSVQPDSSVPADQAADLAAIEKLHQADSAAARIHDINTLITLWTDDGILFLPEREPIRGKAAIWKYMQEQLPGSQKYEISEYLQQFEEVRILGDWAYEWGTFSGTYHLKSGGPDLHERARLFRVLRRQSDGSWKCHRAFAQNLREDRGTPPPDSH